MYMYICWDTYNTYRYIQYRHIHTQYIHIHQNMNKYIHIYTRLQHTHMHWSQQIYIQIDTATYTYRYELTFYHSDCITVWLLVYRIILHDIFWSFYYVLGNFSFSFRRGTVFVFRRSSPWIVNKVVRLLAFIVSRQGWRWCKGSPCWPYNHFLLPTVGCLATRAARSSPGQDGN